MCSPFSSVIDTSLKRCKTYTLVPCTQLQASSNRGLQFLQIFDVFLIQKSLPHINHGRHYTIVDPILSKFFKCS